MKYQILKMNTKMKKHTLDKNLQKNKYIRFGGNN